jgi:hypothetical protein
VAALLRFQQQRKSRIAADVDARDGIHLDGDVQFHEASVRLLGGKGLFFVLSMIPRVEPEGMLFEKPVSTIRIML